MSSRTPKPPARSGQPTEPEDAYPRIPEPQQGHGGSLLAFVSVLAVLGFGFWTAFTTLTAPDKPTPRPSPTAAPAQSIASSATPLPAATSAAPAATPSRTATPGAGGGRVHVVGPGDTLTKIAQTYGTTVDAIMAANGITDRSKVLHVGDKLNIP